MSIKFLYFTDSHIRGTTPSSRKDDYRKSLLDKFQQIEHVIREYRVDYVLCGGDLFHQPEVAYSVLNEFIAVLSKWKYETSVEIYSVVGSHDKIGYNATSIYRGAFGTLVEAGLIKVLRDDEPTVHHWFNLREKLNVQISGVSHEFGNDIDLERYWIPKATGVHKMIQICHGPIVQTPQRFPHICTKDIKTEADLVLCGHIHDGFPLHKIGNVVFANPGSLGRIENTAANRNRVPTVLLIEITYDKSSIKEIPLNCKKGDDIFIEKEATDETDISSFLDELKSHITDVQDLSYKEIVHRIGTELQTEPEIIEKSLTVLDGVGAYEF